MFTGIVEEVGRIHAVEAVDGARRFVIDAPIICTDIALGDSVSVDGVCLTATDLDGNLFTVQAIGTTLGRTTLGEFQPGRRVNLERALAVGQRLGGHIVQGHIDDTGVVTSLMRAGEHVLLNVEIPAMVREITVLHGSIAINGVSLTINELTDDAVQVALIPFTWEHTALSQLEAGQRVNLEGDMFGRYVVEYLKRTRSSGVGENL